MTTTIEEIKLSLTAIKDCKAILSDFENQAIAAIAAEEESRLGLNTDISGLTPEVKAQLVLIEREKYDTIKQQFAPYVAMWNEQLNPS